MHSCGIGLGGCFSPLWICIFLIFSPKVSRMSAVRVIAKKSPGARIVRCSSKHVLFESLCKCTPFGSYGTWAMPCCSGTANVTDACCIAGTCCVGTRRPCSLKRSARPCP